MLTLKQEKKKRIKRKGTKWREEKGGWVNSHLSPSFSPIFSPNLGRKKKKTPKWWVRVENTWVYQNQPPLPLNQTRALFKIPPIFLFPCSISPKSTKRALVDAKYQSHSLINCVIFMYVFVDNNLMPLLYDYLLLLILP